MWLSWADFEIDFVHYLKKFFDKKYKIYDDEFEKIRNFIKEVENDRYEIDICVINRIDAFINYFEECRIIENEFFFLKFNRLNIEFFKLDIESTRFHLKNYISFLREKRILFCDKIE